MSDLFASTCADQEHDSRVVRISARQQWVRLRSQLLWTSLHWADRSILCGGEGCPACDRGYTRRKYAFAAVDRQGNTAATIQLTEGDVCLLKGLGDQAGVGTTIGSAFRVWREKTRQPMKAEYCGFTAELILIPRERVIVDVLRIHGVAATEADVSSGGYRRLVQMRCADLIGGVRAMA